MAIRNADVLVGTVRTNADGDVGVPNTAGGGKGWYSRGYLPHRDAVGLVQAITFRLADSMPQSKLVELEAELQRLPSDRRATERHRRIERWLDAGMGCCALGHASMASAWWAENADGDVGVPGAPPLRCVGLRGMYA